MGWTITARSWAIALSTISVLVLASTENARAEELSGGTGSDISGTPGDIVTPNLSDIGGTPGDTNPSNSSDTSGINRETIDAAQNLAQDLEDAYDACVISETACDQLNALMEQARSLLSNVNRTQEQSSNASLFRLW